MPQSETYTLRRLELEDLEMVRQWRNHPDIRRFMLTQHVISQDEHITWFGRCSRDETRRLYVLRGTTRIVGFAQLSDVCRGGVANWGFYVSPDAIGGTGSELGRQVLGEAFRVEGLHRVCGYALDLNEASRRLHLRLGFTQEGVLREHVSVEGNYRDLMQFGILSREFLGAQV